MVITQVVTYLRNLRVKQSDRGGEEVELFSVLIQKVEAAL